MTETPAPAIVKTVEHTEASRLPDTSWLWRRLLIYFCCGVSLFIAWRLSERVIDPTVMREIIRYSFGITALALTLYGVGATCTDVATLITSFMSTKKITETSAPAPSVVTPGHADTTSQAHETFSDEGELPQDQRVNF